MIKLPYDDVNFYYITNHYDLHITGYCLYNGKLAKFDTEWDDPKDAECTITELSFYERMKSYLYIHVYLRAWYIYRWGTHGIQFWKRWYYDRT